MKNHQKPTFDSCCHFVKGFFLRDYSISKPFLFPFARPRYESTRFECVIKPCRSWDIHVYRTHCENSLRHALAEWLRRWTKNLMGALRAGSILGTFFFFFLFYFFYDNDGGATRSGAGERKAQASTFRNERSECRR